jgi:hypothetical protein
MILISSDGILLCDLMEAWRKVLIKMFHLDITHYFILLMFSFDADLQITKDFEEAKRGRICNIGQTKDVADNNQYMGDLFDHQHHS